MAATVQTVTTSLRLDEITAIDKVMPGLSRAQNLRVLIRFGLKNAADVHAFVATASQEPFDN